MAATTEFCRQCGTKIPHDSKFCENCGATLTETPTVVPQPEVVGITQPTNEPTAVAAPPQTSASAPKPRRIPTKLLIAVVILVCLVTLALVVPCIPIVRSQVVKEEFTYAYTYPVTEKLEMPHRESVFSSGSVKLEALKSFYQTDYYWTSRSFRLESGWKVEVTFETDSYAMVEIYVVDRADTQGNTYYSGQGRDGWFIAPKSGDFFVTFLSIDLNKPHTASAWLSAEWTEVRYEQREETMTKTTTFDVTRYNVTYARPIDLLLDRI